MMRLLYHSVSYVDRASSNYTSRIGDLLVECLTNNAERHITGALAFTDGKFLQVIEGPIEPVERLIIAIARDPRHFDLKLVHRTRTDRREFPFWSMAFLCYDAELRGIFTTLESSDYFSTEAGEQMVGKLAHMAA
jgi:hypothetical protein